MEQKPIGYAPSFNEGQEDIYFPVESAHRFHQDISHSQLHVYPEVGHLPMEESPSASLTDFRDFIRSQMN